MKIGIRTAWAGSVMLVAMVWMQDAHAQRSPWWERQKAAQATAGGTAGESAAQVQAVQSQDHQHARHPHSDHQHAGEQSPAYRQPYAPVAPRETVEPGYTYIEAGATRLDVDVYDIDESGDGGYVRGSVAVTEDLYVFGGHDRASESWSDDEGRLKVAIDQTEIGVGGSIRMTPRGDFISELSLLRFGARVDIREWDYPEYDLSGSDHVYAGKLMFGFRARPISQLELWAKAGYLHFDDRWIDDSMVGNLGIQYRFSPVWGLVGEVEFYEDVRFYRLGVRASF